MSRDAGSDTRPITGVTWDRDDAQFGDDPSSYYRWLRDEEPVHLHAASGSYFLSRFADVLRATEDWQTFSSQTIASRLRHMASLDPPDHDRLRASVARHFSPHAIARLEPTIRRICRSLLAPLEREPRFDLVDRFAKIFPSRVIHHLLGIPHGFDEPLRTVALSIGSARDAAALADGMNALETLTQQIVISEETLETPGILRMLDWRGTDASLDRNEARGICSNLVLAGTDTVTNLIGNGVVLLARHPDARDALSRGTIPIEHAVEEILRFESPVQSLGRRVMRKVTMHGVTLDEGDEIRLQWGAANRDDRAFADPDRFDIRRSASRHLALGHGRHFCLGAALARLEARIAFEELLARWPALPVDESCLRRLPSLWVRAWERIDLVPFVRRS